MKNLAWKRSLMCSCDKDHPSPDSTLFNGCRARSALFPICIVSPIVFVLFPQLYLHCFLFVLFPLRTKGIDNILLHTQKSKFGPIASTAQWNFKINHRKSLMVIVIVIVRIGKVSWDGLDGLTDCPALPSLPYLLHRLLGGHDQDANEKDKGKDKVKDN